MHRADHASPRSTIIDAKHTVTVEWGQPIEHAAIDTHAWWYATQLAGSFRATKFAQSAQFTE